MKAAALLLAGSMALAACASDEPEGSTGGGGGGDAAIEQHGGEVTELSPNADASNRADLLTQLADQGFNPIIAVGFAYSDVIGEVAKQYPDTQFAIVDSSALDADGKPLGAGNITGLQFAANEGSYLGGVAAAL